MKQINKRVSKRQQRNTKEGNKRLQQRTKDRNDLFNAVTSNLGEK